ncbi:MAG TPA: hypothetical protein DCG75_16870 [Bacteroidales bacterium]|nr:hypothetical protein [Bacteroidales bacterium]
MKTNCKRILLFLVFYTIIQFHCFASNPLNFNYCLLEFIQIEGETNINQFNLTYYNHDSGITNRINKIELNEVNEIIEFKIPVNNFKGKNYLMESDFQDLLSASSYPLIIVGINSKLFNQISSGTENNKIEFLLTIAGKTRNIVGHYNTSINKNQIRLKGITKIGLKDFSIEPPQKMFGMLQVKDSIIIKFDILITNEN